MDSKSDESQDKHEPLLQESEIDSEASMTPRCSDGLLKPPKLSSKLFMDSNSDQRTQESSHSINDVCHDNMREVEEYRSNQKVFILDDDVTEEKIDDNGKQETSDTKEKVAKPPLYQGKKVMAGRHCCSKLFFSWVTPIVDFARKYEKLEFEELGELLEEDKVEPNIVKLNEAW